MNDEYRMEHDKNYATLKNLLDKPSPTSERRKCLFCGKRVFRDDGEPVARGLLVQTDLDANYPTEWIFCNAECFTKHLFKGIRKLLSEIIASMRNVANK